MISGKTILIAHLGYPTDSFRAPMIYNPYFESIGLDAVVVPMGVRSEDFASVLRPLFRLSNIRGALVTMPHKAATMGLVDAVGTAAAIAGSANAILLRPDGTLLADMFDGVGFVRAMRRKGYDPGGRRALVIGCGGVGCAIAAALADAGLGAVGLYDIDPSAAAALRERLQLHFPGLDIVTDVQDPAGFDIVVNATPLGMRDGDRLPLDVSRLAPRSFVGEVVMREALTPLLAAAQARGCSIQLGTDMLFEQIPAYLEFFGFPAATAEELRRLATIVW
jgi:shikimate dehydrogenase